MVVASVAAAHLGLHAENLSQRPLLLQFECAADSGILPEHVAQIQHQLFLPGQFAHAMELRGITAAGLVHVGVKSRAQRTGCRPDQLKFIGLNHDGVGTERHSLFPGQKGETEDLRFLFGGHAKRRILLDDSEHLELLRQPLESGSQMRGVDHRRRADLNHPNSSHDHKPFDFKFRYSEGVHPSCSLKIL